MRRRILGTSVTWAAMVAAVALVMVMGSGTAHAATKFDPSGTLCLNKQETIPTNVQYAPCDGSKAPGASDAIAARFGIGLGANLIPEAGGGDDTPDTNFGAVISFTPEKWFVARDADIPGHGALVAQLHSIATLGLLGNPCNNSLQPSFDLLDASTNPADTIAVKPPGAKDRLEPLAKDNNGNGIFDGAEKWPAYLNDLFEDEIAAGVPDPLPNIRARLFGVNNTAVAETTIVLNFLIFEPGTELSDNVHIDSRLGYPSVTVLQDPTAPASGSDPINDFCSPLLSVTNTFAITKDNPNSPVNEAGHDFRTNASADGTYPFVTFSASLPDADNDGIENGFDPCPFDDDTGWNPRSVDPGPITGDADGDGLPDSCDPKPNQKSPINGSILDEDLDGWMNRSDNCPLKPNADNNDEDSDGIGDACDPDIDRTAECQAKPGGPWRQVGTIDGCIKSKCFVTNIGIGAGGTPAIDPQTLAPCDAYAPDDTGGGGGDGNGDGGGATPTPTPTTVAPKKIDKEVKAGETVSTSELGYATADDPVVVDVTSPIGDTISIEITDVTVTPPQGFSFLSWQVEISGPDATPDDPLVIAFKLDASILGGQNENTIQIFKDGVQVGACSGASGTASPDPCVSSRELLSDGESAGDVKITVLTSTASSWNLGVATAVAGETGGPDGGVETGVGSLAPVASSIPIWAAIASSLGGAGLLGTLGAFLARIVRRRR